MRKICILIALALAAVSLRPLFEGAPLLVQTALMPEYHEFAEARHHHAEFLPHIGDPADDPRLNRMSNRHVRAMGERLAQVQAVPFSAATATLWLAFALLLTPLGRGRGGLVRVAALSVAAFTGLEFLVESIMFPWPTIAEATITSRMYIPIQTEYLDMPFRLRLHYYLFTAALVWLAVTLMWALLARARGEGPSRRAVAMLGLVTVAYAALCVYGAVIMYDNAFSVPGYRAITVASLLQTAACIAISAIGAGLCVRALGARPWGAGLTAALTAAAMYAAQAILLDGRLYVGASEWLKPLFPWGGTWLDVVIILGSAVLAMWLARWMSGGKLSD